MAMTYLDNNFTYDSEQIQRIIRERMMVALRKRLRTSCKTYGVEELGFTNIDPDSPGGLALIIAAVEH